MKLHLPKQLFTALLAAITLAATPTAKGKEAFTNIDFTGDFYAKTYEFSFILNDGAVGGSVVGAYWGGSPTNEYGANALTIINVVSNADGSYTYTLGLGRGALDNANIDLSTTFTPKSADEDAITFTGTFESGVVYTISGLDGGSGDKHASASITQMASGSSIGAVDKEYYKNNMNGSASKGNGVNSAYSVAGSSLVWSGSGDSVANAASSQVDILSNWKTATLTGTASSLANANLIFDATSTVAKTVDISDSISVASIKVYDNYTFNATAATTLTTTSGLTVASGKTLTLAGADITLVSPVANNGTLALSNKVILQAAADRELGNVKLGTDSTLEIFNSGDGRVVGISDLTVIGTATIATWKNSSCYHGTINISDLAGSSATLVLKNGSQTAKTTLFNLGDSNTSTEYTGKIRLQGEAETGSARRVALNINDSDVAKGSVIEFCNDTNNNSALGLGASEVKVAGLNDVTADGSNYESGTDNVNIYGYKVGGGASNFNRDTADTDQQARTLEITGSGTYKTNAVINGGVNIKMSGTGTQTFTNTANLGKVTVSAGSLTFAGATTVSGDIDSSGSLTFAGATTTLSGDKLTVSSGTLSYEGTTDQKYKVLNTVVSSGATLKISDGDSIDYTSTPGMTMSVAGKLELGERQTLGEGFSLILSDGAEVTGGGSLGGLDFNGEGGSITSNGATYIKEKAIRLRSNDVRIDVQSGTLTTNTIVHNASDAISGIIKEGAGTLKITSMAQGGTNNGYQEVFFDGTTTLKAGTVEYALTEAGTYKGAITGTGNIKNSGSAAVTLEDVRDLTGTIEVASGTLTITELTNLQGALDIDGGTLNITTLNALKTISVSIANGGTLSLGAVVVDSDMQALDKVSDSSYYSVDGTTSSDNGYLVRTGKYLLFNGYAWQGEDVGDDGYTVISDAGAKKTYIEIESSKGSTFFVNTTLSSSDISGAAIAEQYHVNTDGSFTIAGDVTDGKTAAQLLTSTTGTGTLILSADNVSITESASTAFKGTLKIDGSGLLGDNYRTLTIGNGPGKTANIASLKEVQLVGQSKIQYHANPTSATDIQKLSVAENGKGQLYFEDSDDSEMRIGEVQLAASSEFTMSGKWQDSAITIGKLNGSGSFTYESPSSSRQALTIDSLQGFEGELVLDNSAGHAGYSAIINTGTGNSVTFGSLTAEGSGTVFNVQRNTTVDTIAVASGVVNFSAGTKLTLRGDTANPSSIGTITADAGGNIIHLNETATLNRLADISGGSITLTGSGTYDLGMVTYLGSSGNSFTDYMGAVAVGSDWTGTIKLSGTAKGVTLTHKGSTSSWLQLDGLTGWFAYGVSHTANLNLTGNGLVVDDNSTKSYSHTGAIKGEGNYTIQTISGYTPTYEFTGDLSKWAGAFVVKQHATDTDKPDVTLNLTNGGTLYSGAETSGIRMEREGTLTVNIGKADSAGAVGEEGATGSTIMRGAISNTSSGTLNLNVKGSTAFDQNVTVTSMTVDAGKTATVNATLSAGTVNLGSNATVTVGAGENRKVSLQNDALVITATDSTKAATMTRNADTQGALARLQEDASFTIEDMTLVNTTITAANVDTQVNLKNVSGDATLKTGTFALQVSANAPDNVGMGMSYAVTGTPSLTLANATAGDTKLVIAADPTADVSGAYGTYTLTFNLNLDLDASISIPETGKAWKELVGFEGWLGTMLENQGATYLPADEVEVAQVDAGTSTPTVSYSYTEGTGGNVGTLAIVISGLNVPEPTTSTLSLLALAALAARRRRND